MKRTLLAFSLLAVLIGATCVITGLFATRSASETADAPDSQSEFAADGEVSESDVDPRPQPAGRSRPQNVASFQSVLELSSESRAVVDRSLAAIARGWHPGMVVMLVEISRFTRSRYAFTETLALLENKTGQKFGQDFDSWYRWIWNRPYEPHPQYASFKSGLYSGIDGRFAEYFQQTDNARIRLDEIRWGGVIRDGIPPLKNPKMISARKATYLASSDVVFGVKLNEDARCYPKRILAWHEMFKDTIGSVPVCGAY